MANVDGTKVSCTHGSTVCRTQGTHGSAVCSTQGTRPLLIATATPLLLPLPSLQAVRELGLSITPVSKSVVDMAESLIQLGIATPRRQQATA